MIRRRKGQILFLEFMATLPIFALLFLACSSFHKYYLYTTQEAGRARLGAWRRSLQHISQQPDVQNVQLTDRQVDDPVQPRTSSPADNSLKDQEAIAVAESRVTVPTWLGTGTAVGAARVTQDAWNHEEIGQKAGPLLRNITLPQQRNEDVHPKPTWNLVSSLSDHNALEGRGRRAGSITIALPQTGQTDTSFSAAQVLYGNSLGSGEVAGGMLDL